ncbi:MAG: guanylate kinase [Gemmatimonadetes bacterium]|nr:guanylate kinase [Gemmatimonadota bacterium]
MSLGSRPFPFVVAAPSGTGKTTLARALVDRNDDVVFSTSATTRPARPNEREGRDYHFVDDLEFDRMIETGELIEWAVVHGRRYGTPNRGVEEGLKRGSTVVLDIDVQGARQIRKLFPDSVLVFVLPPSGTELGRRLGGRGSEKPAEQRRRLETAKREIDAAGEFDYVVVNDDFEAALRALETILVAERHRRDRVVGLEAAVERLEEEVDEILERSS